MAVSIPNEADLLIDDAGRRRHLELPTIDPNGDIRWKSEAPRMLQDLQNDLCFCDVNFVNEARPLTVDEFSDALSDAIGSSGLNFTSTGIVDTSATLAPTTLARTHHPSSLACSHNVGANIGANNGANIGADIGANDRVPSLAAAHYCSTHYDIAHYCCTHT